MPGNQSNKKKNYNIKELTVINIKELTGIVINSHDLLYVLSAFGASL
jgi:hypothetical protein